MRVTQSAFHAALLNPDKPVPEGLTDADARPAARRFDVYRNNVVVSLRDALITAFPLVTKLLGQQNMEGLGAAFARLHPPQTPLMMAYGQALPDFLEGHPQLQHLPYLGDAARLDLALRRAYHAADAPAFDPAALATADPTTLESATLTLAPALQVLRSRWPLYDIWRYNNQDGAEKPRAQAQDLVILRPGFDPAPHLLPPGAAIWIDAIAQSRTIAQAQAEALHHAPDFDLSPVLALLLQGQAIVSFHPKGSS